MLIAVISISIIEYDDIFPIVIRVLEWVSIYIFKLFQAE